MMVKILMNSHTHTHISESMTRVGLELAWVISKKKKKRITIFLTGSTLHNMVEGDFLLNFKEYKLMIVCNTLGPVSR